MIEPCFLHLFPPLIQQVFPELFVGELALGVGQTTEEWTGLCWRENPSEL